jgi:K+-transporting ATPase KdpF subunit
MRLINEYLIHYAESLSNIFSIGISGLLHLIDDHMYISGIVIGFLILIYLFIVLFRPEKF